MKPQSAKAKGRRLQQQIMHDLLSLFPHLADDDIRSTSMGAGGEDIQLSTAARRVLPYTFEAKNQVRVNIWSAIEQAHKNNPSPAHTPIVIFKKNGERPYVAFEWAHFLQLIKNPSHDEICKTTKKEQLIRVGLHLKMQVLVQMK